MNDLQAIAEQINVVAAAHPRMRNFQEIRRKIHGLSRLKTKKIFSEQTIFKHWAAHSGGRHELQYNIGFEDEWFRYGVAFSLQPSRTLPNPSVLKPRIARYNRYIQKNGSSLADLSFWYWSNGVRSPSLPVAEIPDTLIRPPNFLFLGKTCERDEIDPDTVVFLFDRLLDLYQYVEGNTPLTTRPANLQKGFQFKSGCAQKATSAWANVKGGARNVNLAHNGLQQALFDILSVQHGKNVGAENDTGRGSRVDLVVLFNGKRQHYEIKVGPSIRSCFRQAIGQLLEYSYWPTGPDAERMIIVSENQLTPDSRRYLEKLRKNFNLPIFYQQLDMKSKTLGPLE